MSQNRSQFGFPYQKSPKPSVADGDCLMPTDFEPTELLRLPGLYRAWELAQMVETDCDYRVESAGETAEGAPLFAIYRDQRAAADMAGCLP
jgi:hypothetical protein